jgi:hypothetical protein
MTCSSEPECEVHAEEETEIGNENQRLDTKTIHKMMQLNDKMNISVERLPEVVGNKEENTRQDDTNVCETSSYDSSSEQKKESAIQKVDDLNSIVASDQDEYSSHSGGYLMSDFNIFDLVGRDNGDDDSSYCIDIEGTDSEIQAAINDIRKEAAQMDAIMALDQIKSLQSELESMNRQLSARSMENEDLKIQLEESEDRAAHAKLERDLFKADALKLREDLKTCVNKMFDISLYESAADEEAKLEEHDQPTGRLLPIPSGDQYDNATIRHQDARQMISSEQMPQFRIMGLADQPRKVLRRLPTLSDPGLLTMHSKRQWSEDSDSQDLLPSRKDDEPVRNQDVFRRRSSHSFRRPRTDFIRRRKEASSTQRKISIYKQGKFVQRPRSFSIERKIYHKSQETESDEKENKICGIFRRRARFESDRKENDISAMKNQISQLHEMMKVSLSASEKLRKRLATISRYYEGVISKLQDQVAEVKGQKSRMEVDLRNLISERDLEMRRKDEEIKRLKAMIQDRGEV